MSEMGRDHSDHSADLGLLQSVIQQEPQAWQTFYKRHERLILACLRRVYARYHVPLSREELEDLMGIVCLDLVRDNYRKLRLFDPERGYRLSSWIGLLATNVAHDSLRRRAPPHTSTDDADSPLAELQSRQLDPLEQLDFKEKVNLLARAIQELIPTDQEFIRLYYDDQLSPDEIAKSTGVSINTVYSRKNKVRGKLIKLIRSYTRSDLLQED